MIKSYFITAFRNILRQKAISGIHIFGLSIGIASCLIIFLYVDHESNYDAYNRHSKNTVRISSKIHAPESDMILAGAPGPLPAVLARDYPSVVAATKLGKDAQNFVYQNVLIREQNVYTADSSIFSIFDFEFIHGNHQTALKNPGDIVLSSSLAKKYFGKSDPTGKLLTTGNGSMKITGVYRDRPGNSDLTINALRFSKFERDESWDGFDLYVYALLKPGTDLKKFTSGLAAISKDYIQPAFDKMDASEYHVELISELLEDVHFSRGKLADTPKANKNVIYMFSGLAIFILLVALLNYINLCTARSVSRAKEVGVRKVIGAGRWQLIKQFLFESFLLISVAAVFALLIAAIAVPWLEQMLQAELVIDYFSLMVFTVIIISSGILLAGFYPAFVLSGFQPIKVLKGTFSASASGNILKKIVTTTQFAIAVALIFSTIVIYRQMNYISTLDIGYDTKQLFIVHLPNDTTMKPFIRSFRNELMQKSGIGQVSLSGGLEEDGRTIGTAIVNADGKRREIMSYYFSVDDSFIDVYGMKLAEGRNLSDTLVTDHENAYIANRAFVREMGWKTGLNKEVEGWGGKGKIIGVVDDFHFKSVHNKVEPALLVFNKASMSPIAVSLKIPPSMVGEIRELFTQYFPAIAFDYSFVNDSVEQQYRKDKVTLRIFSVFTVLAVFLSALGLFALVSLILKQRQKEIGVRKVLGANGLQLFGLISKELAILMLVGSVIALPLASYLMKSWLRDFAYNSGFSWWMFIIPSVSLTFIALIVINKELFKAIKTNPAVVLKSDS
jgi:putative ABC transport system permease protein